jgi:hypothetical protein
LRPGSDSDRESRAAAPRVAESGSGWKCWQPVNKTDTTAEQNGAENLVSIKVARTFIEAADRSQLIFLQSLQAAS